MRRFFSTAKKYSKTSKINNPVHSGDTARYLQGVKESDSYQEFFNKFFEECEKEPETKQICVIRHGRSLGNQFNLLYGQSNFTEREDLVEEGVDQAVALSAEIEPFTDRFVTIESSDLVRARQTMSLALRKDIDAIKGNRLVGEFNFGPFERTGLNRLSFDENDFLFSLFVNGKLERDDIESGDDVVNRIRKYAVEELNQSGPHLIFSHSGVVQSCLRKMKAIDTEKNPEIGEFGFFPIGYCGALAFRVGEDGYPEQVLAFYGNLETKK